MERREILYKTFGYCLVIGVVLGLLGCLFSAIASPEDLTAEERATYQQLATEYYKTGEYNSDSNISVSYYSQHLVNVVDNSRPFTPSLSFEFDEDNNKVVVHQDINLAVIRVFPVIIMVSVVIMVVVGFILSIIGYFFIP